jgi:hypothetical protein
MSSSLLLARALLYLARHRLPRFQRLILLFEFSWASQRLSAQLNPGCYLFTPSAQPLGAKSDDVIQPKVSKLQASPGRQADGHTIQYSTPERPPILAHLTMCQTPTGLSSEHDPRTGDTRGQMSLDPPRPSERKRTSRRPSTALEQGFSRKPTRTS